MSMSDNERYKNLPEETEPESIPELDPEVIPKDEPPYGDFNQQPFGNSRFFRMHLNCCGCSGSTILLVILGVILLIILYAKR